jgi:hypothetical protein
MFPRRPRPRAAAAFLNNFLSTEVEMDSFANHDLASGERRWSPDPPDGMPRRFKCGQFDRRRTAASANLIRRQINYVTPLFPDGLHFDNVCSNWVVYHGWRLPHFWGVPSTSLLICFPADYPCVPPVGFYLPKSLKDDPSLQFRDPHFDGQPGYGANEEPVKNGWLWYCCNVFGVWRPAADDGHYSWINGDNLWTYNVLVHEVLSSPPEHN